MLLVELVLLISNDSIILNTLKVDWFQWSMCVGGMVRVDVSEKIHLGFEWRTSSLFL